MKRNEKTKRNRKIYESRIQGQSYRKIAEVNGISICRVRQIIDAEERKSGRQSKGGKLTKERSMAELRVDTEEIKKHIDKRIQELKKEFITKAAVDRMIDEIEAVKAVMNEEIREHDRKDLINFVNGINQCLVIIEKYRNEETENGANEYI